MRRGAHRLGTRVGRRGSHVAALLRRSPRRYQASHQRLGGALRCHWRSVGGRAPRQKQRNALLRLGVAFSVFGELEHATLKYTPTGTPAAEAPSPTTQPTPVSLPKLAAQRYRWVVRPTLELWPSDRWAFRADWYLKLPLSNSEPTIPGEAKSRFDYRYDLNVRVAFNVTQKELGQPGDVSVEVRYRRIFDNVPPFSEPAAGASTPFLIAPDTHRKIYLNFNVKW